MSHGWDDFGRLAATTQEKPEASSHDDVPDQPCCMLSQEVPGFSESGEKLNGDNHPGQPVPSEEFQRLVNQILFQHVREQSDLRSEVMQLQGENKALRESLQTCEPAEIPRRARDEISQSQQVRNILRKRKLAGTLKAADVMDALNAAEEQESQGSSHLEEAQAADAVDDGQESESKSAAIQQSKIKRLDSFLQSDRFEMIISGLLCLNVLFMALELQYLGLRTGYSMSFYEHPYLHPDLWPTIDLFFLVGDRVFTSLFFMDVFVRIIVLKLRFWALLMNWVDAAVVLASMVELFAKALPFSPVLFRLLRIGKLARALRMVTMTNALQSLQLLIKCIAASVDMLFWSFFLLAFIQCVAGMIISHLAREYTEDDSKPLELRQEVFMYYGTFSRTFLSMFEILFANWSPACRVLMENVSEAFSVFFLLYRCILGFAVLNVVNAVFVQQTMKTAGSDEELAFKQKQKDLQNYQRKVKKLFKSIDCSGDGSITFDEFSKLVKSPKLKFWMSQLELEYHDLLSLFEFLDDGDGEITLSEFIEGAGRLKGQAKAIDIWRLETKIEVLFEEVLKGQPHADLQEVFDSSGWSHIRKTATLSK